MKPKRAQLGDYRRLLGVVDEHGVARPANDFLARLLFTQGAPLSFILEAGDGRLVGFLLGSLSSQQDEEARIHCAWVEPGFRRLGLGRRLYERFFAGAHLRGRDWVSCETALTDRASLAFHLSMGFHIAPGGGVIDGIPVQLGRAGDGGHTILFRRRLTRNLTAAPLPVAPLRFSPHDVAWGEPGPTDPRDLLLSGDPAHDTQPLALLPA